MKTMKQFRRRLAAYLAGSIGSYLLHGFICLIYRTMRITHVGKEIVPEFIARGEGFIGTFWHGRMLLIPFLYPGRAMHVLISIHRDGEIIANVMKLFGFGLVRGSSKKGGTAALREMLQLLKENKDLAITPDGPKGPAEVLKPGIAEVARLSGKAVIPVTFSASPCFRATSWDRFMIPYPFSRGVLYVGEPVRYEKGEEMEAFRLRLETALRDVTARADAMVGRKA
jgi:lysophospholipid acyltransferase (LPLAT)-like uncharacterized protein